MSLRYKGALLSATPPTVNADDFGSAKGIWTMQQQFQYEGAGTWPSPFTPRYIEDVFSTYLYTGNGASQTIVNNIAFADGPTNGTVLHLTGDSLTDSSTLPSSLTIEGNTAVNTTTKKYGTGSIYFDGSGDRIVVPAATKLDLSGDFTIEMWVYPSRISSYQVLFDTSAAGSAGSNMTEFWIGPSGYIQYYARGSILLTSTTALSTNTWYHIALSKQGSTQRLFINGTVEATTTSTTQPNTGYNWYIGDRQASAGSGQYPLQGYIDDFRIIKDQAIYTSNFTSPADALPLDVLTEGKGGLVWYKARSGTYGTSEHNLVDTARGATYNLQTDNTAVEFTNSTGLTSFTSKGFTLGSSLGTNGSSTEFASWSFRKAPKFFDVITYTGNGSSTRTLTHSLGTSSIGAVVIKTRDNGSGNWVVWHRSLDTAKYLRLNAAGSVYTTTNSNSPVFDITSTEFKIYNTVSGGIENDLNVNGQRYICYVFAHDAGGFGDAGDQSVIKCGSYTTDGSGNATVDLGWEPQWLLQKRSDSSTGGNWALIDNMRGFTVTDANNTLLRANTSDAEVTSHGIRPSATGFTYNAGTASATFIYIAIRRGPMKTPEAGTEVLVPYAYDGSGAGTYTTGINQDLFFAKSRNSGSYVWNWYDRLRGANQRLQSNATNAEASVSGVTDFNNTSMIFAASDGFSSASPFGGPYIGYAFRRAPGFFDVVCYTGTGSNRTVSHNLGVAPELMIVKRRTVSTGDWHTYVSSVGATKAMYLNLTNTPDASSAYWNDTSPTSSVFSVGTGVGVNANGSAYVAYLFASCPGVSKVGSVSYSGSAVNVDCGFTSGARFVLIKRSDDTGSWQVFDTARGIVAGNDPYLYLNSTAAENSDGAEDCIDTYSSGFTITTGFANIVGTGTFIYLAIA